MSDLIFSLNAVLPIFFCCAMGYVLRNLKLINENFVQCSTKVVFYVAIPCTILRSILGCDIKSSFNLKLVLFVVIGIFCTASILMLFVPMFIKSRKKAATVTVDMFRGNFAILGVPLAQSLLGDKGTAPTMMLIPFGMLSYNVLTVAIFVMFGSGIKAKSKSSALADAFIKALKNPLTIASFVSIALAMLSVDLPVVIDNTIDKFADMTTGLALVMLGAQFNFVEAKKRLRYSIPTVIIRLVAIPLAVVILAILMGFRGAELIAIYIFFAAPSAVNCFVLADCLNGDKDIAADAIMTTSSISIITFVVGVFLLRKFALF